MKKYISLILCALLLVGLVFPAYAVSTDNTETTATVETTVPETTVPETTVPETTVPETTVPETTVPETTVPETTVPETTVPETTVPETTVPETTVPATTETTLPTACEECGCTDGHWSSCSQYEQPDYYDLPEELRISIMEQIMEKEGLLDNEEEEETSTFSMPRMFKARAATVYIEKNWFEVEPANAATIDNNGVAAGDMTILPEGVTEVSGYTYVGAYYENHKIVTVGQIDVSENDVKATYVYYITENSTGDLVATVLGKDQKIELRFKRNAVGITYRVTVDDGDAQTTLPITVSGIPYGSTTNGRVTVISEDSPTSVFPGDGYSFNVTIPRGYTATVMVNNEALEPELGLSPTYTGDYDSVSKTENSPEYLLSNTYTVRNVQNAQAVEVRLTKKSTYSFSADLWKDTKYVERTNRANSYINPEYWWNDDISWENSSTNCGSEMTWIIRTKGNRRNGPIWMLDSLQINGTDISVPFTNNTVTTQLPSGTNISIRREMNGRESNYYNYTITISDCYEDLVVTGGNLNNVHSWKEFMPYSFTGVDEFQSYNFKSREWVTLDLNDPIGHDTSFGDYHNYDAEFRFKLLPGYGNPTFTLYGSGSNDEPTIIDDVVSAITGPDNDGYYSVTVDKSVANRDDSPWLIVIGSDIINVSVTYRGGDVTNATNLPSDDNTYSLAAGEDNDVLISGYIPVDPDGNHVFTGWAVQKADGTYVQDDQGKILLFAPNQNVLLSDLTVVDETVTFVAQWVNAATAEMVTYMVEIVEYGHEDVVLNEVTLTGQCPAGTAVVLQITDTNDIGKWLAENDNVYELDTEHTQYYYGELPSDKTLIVYVKEKTATIRYVPMLFKNGTVVDNPEPGFGSVTPPSETIKVRSGTVSGSAATAGDKYRFVGWYSDAKCTNQVGIDAKYVPTKSGNLWTNATYYAMFEEATGTLKISKTVTKEYDEDTIPENAAFKFTVDVYGNDTSTTYDYTITGAGIETSITGYIVDGGTLTLKDGQTATIADVPAGAYTVTEVKDAENPDYRTYVGTVDETEEYVASGNLQPGGTDTVAFTNVYKRHLADLTIQKEGSNETLDSGATYIFKVEGQGISMEVCVQDNTSVTIKDLPVGTYTVTEVTGWSWRYDSYSSVGLNDQNQITLQVQDKDSASNTVTITNNRTDSLWLDGYAWAVNLFGTGRNDK